MADKSLGQHWLFDTQVLDEIVDFAAIEDGNIVVEIGPGLGTLTSRLLMSGAKVKAIEFDKELAEKLPKEVASRTNQAYVTNLEIINEDVLKFDFRTLPKNYKIVANIPYYLTAHLLRILNESENPPALTVLLVQKEVAERVCANVGDMSILAVINQFYNECTLGPVVLAKMFTPPPKVDSRVLVMKRQSKLPENIEPKKFIRLVKTGFSSPRKILLNNLSAGFDLPKENVKALLREAGINDGVRPQELSLQQWQKLYAQPSIINL